MKVQDIITEGDGNVEPLFEAITVQAVTEIQSTDFSQPVSAEQLLKDLGIGTNETEQ